MRDGYFYKSLFSTLIVCFIFMSITLSFVLLTGIVGSLCIMVIILLILIYFYSGFEKSNGGY